MATDYFARRDHLRRLLGRSPRSGASSLAPSAPPAVLGHTTGGASMCTGCEDGCGRCIPKATGICDRCQKPYDGGVCTWTTLTGESLLNVHAACMPPDWWEVNRRQRLAEALGIDLRTATAEVRWLVASGGTS